MCKHTSTNAVWRKRNNFTIFGDKKQHLTFSIPVCASNANVHLNGGKFLPFLDLIKKKKLIKDVKQKYSKKKVAAIAIFNKYQQKKHKN